MKLKIEDQKLRIDFTFWEWLLCFKTKLIIPLNHIEKVSFEKPRHGRTSIALTFFSNQAVPPNNLLRIGNHYGDQGPEFWYLYGDPQSKFLTLVLKDDSYKKIVLELEDTKDFEEIVHELGITGKNRLTTH